MVCYPLYSRRPYLLSIAKAGRKTRPASHSTPYCVKGLSTRCATYTNMSVECPTCDRDDFKSERGMKQHHAQTHGEKLLPVSKEELEELYVGERLSQYKVAERLDVERYHVRRAMNQYDIERRDRSEAFVIRFADKPVRYYTSPNGHERLRPRVMGEKTGVAVHQLLAIADGADPYKVFSNGEWACHHKNGVPWDNRHENIEVLTRSDHAKEHYNRGDFLPETNKNR